MKKETHTPDLESIAALLDGRLRGEERTHAIRQIASDPDSVELFALSGQALEEEAGDEEKDEASEDLPENKPTLAPNSVLTFPPRSSPPRRVRARRWRTVFSIAATLAAVAVCFVLLRGSSSTVTGAELAATLADTSKPDEFFSFETKGEHRLQSMANARQRAVQVGAYTLQLQAEIASGGNENFERLLRPLSSLVRSEASLETVPEELARTIESAASGEISPQELRQRLSKWEPLFAQRYGTYFDLGRWIQMVYVASAPGARNLGALRGAPMHQLYKRLWDKRELLASQDAEIVDLLSEVRRLANQPEVLPEEWDQLHRATNTVLRRFAAA